jgi:hypothetical protein
VSTEPDCVVQCTSVSRCQLGLQQQLGSVSVRRLMHKTLYVFDLNTRTVLLVDKHRSAGTYAKE